MKKSLILLFLAGLYVTSSFGASYDTLPKGVDMFVFKQVMTSNIQSRFDNNHNDNQLSLTQDLTSSRLENISDALKTYFNELKAISPEAYNQFSLGEFKVDASAKVNVQGLAIAHGITDHLTTYASLPIYHIKTNVNFVQTKKSNISALSSTLQNASTNSTLSTFVRQLTLQLPETNEQLLQSLIVNYYGYKPLGRLEKDALGDAELGSIYRFTDAPDMGFALALGAVLPTGEAKDPDSLQDVSTGDGQYDAFVESMSGIGFFDNALQFDLKARYTYQFSSKKVMRTISDSNVPLSSHKETMTEKLGNKIDSTFTITLNPTSWLNFNSSYIYNETGASKYGASDSQVKAALEQDSSSTSHWARVGIGLSTVELYKAKKMDVPCEINLYAQRLLNAKNSASYERFDLDFRLYF